MITVANRATPRPLTLEQRENAMVNEGDPNAGAAAEPATPTHDPAKHVARPTMPLPHPKREQRS